jgi:hypothetical protein
MNDTHKPPRTILGIPLKALLVVIILLLGLFAVFDRLDVNDIVAPFRPAVDTADENQRGASKNIVATPEMIKQATRELQGEKLKNLESTENSLPTDRFFYVVELLNGKDLEAVELTIKPDSVTIISAGGIKTTIARAAVKEIKRFKLETTPP